ncbi:serine-enriched protein isoform X1 [Dermatophagoides farinae]|uniref:serine-enriched protein isoform X1 n=2 Tax=Dermatophagoides farinae TaxID=6954 RepID=UPI003F634877
MSSEHRTITFNEVSFPHYDDDDDDDADDNDDDDDDDEDDDDDDICDDNDDNNNYHRRESIENSIDDEKQISYGNFTNQSKQFEESDQQQQQQQPPQQQQQQIRRHEPPKSLHLGKSTTSDRHGKSNKSSSSSSSKNKLLSNRDANDIGTFDFDINFDSDEAEDIIDYSIYENRTGLAEDMKFLASMPELCDITFLVGEKSREPVCGVKAVLASRSRVFHKLLYGQKQPTVSNHHQHHHHHHHGKEEKSNKRKESQRDTKLKLFLKRSSEPILNGLPFNQQQPIVQTHQTMIIEEFEPDVFRQLIEYIHTGCVTLQARTLLGLMNAADYYGLEELRRACIGFVTCCITVDTVNSILASAERYIQYKCTKSLVQRVLEFVDKHGNEVLSLGSFALLPEHVVRLILSREELKADELTKFQAALHWSQRSCEASCGTLDLRDVIANFLECIEFYKIPASVLMREVHPLGVVPDHVIMNALAFQADPSSVDIRKVESPNRFRRMTLPHSYNIAGSDLIHLRHTANFWAERAEAANAAMNNNNNNNSGSSSSGKEKEKQSRRRRASKSFKRSKTLMESS